MKEKKPQEHNIRARIHWNHFSRNLLSSHLSDFRLVTFFSKETFNNHFNKFYSKKEKNT